MARVTIEKCVGQFQNRFELVYAMVQRVKEIEKGDPVKVRRRNHKNHVLALREVEEGMVDAGEMKEKMIIAKQKYYAHKTEKQPLSEKQEVSEEDQESAWEVAAENWKDMEIKDSNQFDSVCDDEMKKEEKE